MADATQSISGLASGFDWKTTVDKLIAIEHQSVDLISTRKSELSSKDSAWKELSSKLETLKAAVDKLKDPSAFSAFSANLSSSSTTAAGDLLGVTVTSDAAPGSYNIQVLGLAQNQKLSSTTFSSNNEALGLSGEFLLGSKVIKVESTDTLTTLRDKINHSNSGTNPSGVSASIMATGTDKYRLVLAASATGAEGVSIRDASTSNVVQSLGFTTAATVVKHATSSGGQSDSLSSADTSVASLLGLSTTPSGSVSIGSHSGITIDLSKSLAEIKDSINSQAGSTIAYVESETDSETSTTTYSLRLVGTSFSDSNNVLQTLGILKGTYSNVAEVQKGTAQKTLGGTAITAATAFSAIDTGGGANTVVNGDTITIDGMGHGGQSVSGTFTVGPASTIQDLLTQIQSLYSAAGASVTASVDGDGKITLVDAQTGDSRLALTLTSNNEGGGTLDLGKISEVTDGRAMQIQAGADASLIVDGVRQTRSSNAIDDIVAGATINLKKYEAGTTVTVDIGVDKDTIAANVQSMVTNFNTVRTWIGNQMSYNADTKATGGPLFGDSTLSGLNGSLLSTVVSSLTGVSSDYNTLTAVGISLSRTGSLEFNITDFKNALAGNLEDVRAAFSAMGTGSSADIQFASTTSDTKAGSYAVNITQAATRALLNGTTALGSGGLSASSVLTIADKASGQNALVNLSAGMSASDVVDAINSELSRGYMRKLTEASGHTKTSTAGGGSISSMTKWAEINTGGDASSLAKGDVISWTGTTRSGISVTGSYALGDPATDTVGNLLSAVRSSYGDKVDVSVDSSGRIVVSDPTSGTSQIAVSFSYSGTGTLAFGNMDVTQNGRYAMNLTASKDAGGHISIQHGTYGAADGFTVSQSVDVLGMSAAQVSGQDVIGTINGEAATGKGQTLLGSSSSSSVNGLSILYKGATTGDVGSINVTLGYGELLSRMLFNYSDPYSGFIQGRREGISSSIKSMDDQITSMEARLSLKKSAMTKKFTAMEKMLSTLQQQGNWLTAQTAKL